MSDHAPWNRRPWLLYGGPAAVLVAVLIGAAALSGGNGRRAELDVVGATPSRTPSPATSLAPSPSTSPTPHPSATGTARPTRPPETTTRPVALENALLPDRWVGTTFGRGRATSTSAQGDAWPCGDEPRVTRRWSWLGETQLTEDVTTWPTVEAARRSVDTCGSELPTPQGETVALRSRTVELGDEALVLRWTWPDRATSGAQGVVRLGRTTALLRWTESGTITSDDAVERALRAATAALQGGALPPPRPEPAPAGRPDVRGYLGGSDVHEWWWRDHVPGEEERSLFSCGTSGAPALPVEGTPVVRRWVNDTGSLWSFARGRASDEATAAAALARCRAAWQGDTVTGVGDDAFCIRAPSRCVARSGRTFYAFDVRDSDDPGADWHPRMQAWLRTAIARDPGART